MVALADPGMDPCQEIPALLGMLIGAAGGVIDSRWTAAIAHPQGSLVAAAVHCFLLDVVAIVSRATAVSGGACMLQERSLRPVMQPVALARQLLFMIPPPAMSDRHWLCHIAEPALHLIRQLASQGCKGLQSCVCIRVFS